MLHSINFIFVIETSNGFSINCFVPFTCVIVSSSAQLNINLLLFSSNNI